VDSLTELFCVMDDFCKHFEPALNKHLLEENKRKRQRHSGLSLSELMTLVVLFHQMRYRQFKYFYLYHVCGYLRREFPKLPSYQRCIALMPRCAVALAALFETLKGKCTGLSIVDATPIAVCDNLRIKRHHVFKENAARGKTSTGWFYGFKLHAIINHMGELLHIKLTPGNVDDRQPLRQSWSDLFGKLYADKGYIGKWLTDWLAQQGVDLVTKVRKNMKPKNISAFDQAMLRQRSLIETVFHELKNLCQIEHTRHRSPMNFVVNLLAGIVAYCFMPNKPRIPVQTAKALADHDFEHILIQN